MIFQSPITHRPLPFDPKIAQEVGALYTSLDQDAVDLLGAIAATSPYLGRLLTQQRDWVLENAAHTPETALSNARILHGDTASALRLAKARVSLLLAICDLAHIRPLEWITHGLTDFADFAVNTALQDELRKIHAMGKLPNDALKQNLSAGIAVFAMGKMGAHELNYSSDIDLIFLFDDSRYPADEVFEYRALFVAVTRKVFQVLNQNRADGYVFRTDLRLRPNPAVTPVCPSMSAAENYYLTEGRTWERSAFIKARACAGDIAAGEAFLSRLQPFIWRRHLDFAALGEIEDLLTLSRETKGLVGPITLAGHNMKLGAGGIREIEFFAQTRQLIFGGRTADLREITTIGALDALAKTERITLDQAQTLSKTYRAHRSIEHRIQMLRDAQTHSIPASDEDFTRLAMLSGYSDPAVFGQEILESLEATRDAAKPTETIAPLGATENEETSRLLQRWRALSSLKPQRTQEILARLYPEIIRLSHQHLNPDQTLEYFEIFLENLSSSVQLFALFERRTDVLAQVFQVVATSKHLARDLGRRTSVLDVLADQGGDAIPASLRAYSAGLDARLDPEADYESSLIQARAWKAEEHFKITYAQLALLIDTAAAERAYSDLAQACVIRMLSVSKQEIERRYGQIKGDIAVLAMGKLGSCEMTATSDLDIIVIFDGDADAMSSRKDMDIRSYFQQLTRTLVTALSSNMSYGRLYEVDMRLRPSGRAGTVATSLEGFEDYQRTKAWVWEHLALTRARVIAGPEVLSQRIEQVCTSVLTNQISASKILAEVDEMRMRIAKISAPKPNSWPVKKPLGGVLDIELLAQTTALLTPVKSSKPHDQLIHAIQSGLVVSSQVTPLIEALDLFRAIEHLKRLVGMEDFNAEHLSDTAEQLFTETTNSASLALLHRAILDHLQKNKTLISDILEGLKP
ncbi:glutamate-ammonia-ligase adenylyltransferase [Amylibacter marinus]|uniref:Glutamate-ammonia-ligase adenylyltransferase n=1 Tax=Amylibacter marinus TaxID=1475483 RepID=A0ABQ5VQT9_9RHOB|nr:DUF294 nucleotidyltransferase-like domain-containing protein [Amylibacter marinus]GLQ33766.1 glutamate-ammonia-ligase adenylyltransferase [Amylibacter marinus]